MPLTYVVEHLNHQLAKLHARTRLIQSAEMRYENGELMASIGPVALYSALNVVSQQAKPGVVIRNSVLSATTLNGKAVAPDFVYQLAWDAEDIVFVDRFVRSFHALNHINQNRDQAKLQPLLLDVHWRHLCAVPDGHGEVFEQLLSTLGLEPASIILRIDASALLDNPRVRAAAKNFRERGYELCVNAAAEDRSLLTAVNALGVEWLSGGVSAETEILSALAGFQGVIFPSPDASTGAGFTETFQQVSR